MIDRAAFRLDQDDGAVPCEPRPQLIRIRACRDEEFEIHFGSLAGQGFEMQLPQRKPKALGIV